MLQRQVRPVIGRLAPPDVQPVHIDRVLTLIVEAGAPTVANDALRYMVRMFRMAVRNQWIDQNPAADFELIDRRGDERARRRWLTIDEHRQLARAIRETPNFGRGKRIVGLAIAVAVRANWNCCQRGGKRSVWNEGAGR